MFAHPTVKQRFMIFGRTGSGKTQFGAFALSRAPFDKQPYVIVDYKGDELLSSIDRAREIGYTDVPKHPGVYYLRAMPNDAEEVERFLWRIWKRGKTGLFFDEGYMVPDNGALQAILTQGRSLRIPVFLLSQRPVWLSRFAFSEADMYAAFHLNDARDMRTVSAFAPSDAAWTTERLPPFHARYYDVSRNASCILAPAPKAEDILNHFDMRLATARKVRVI